ncbi:MAG: LysM peptidoglycan-binding domain-containing protein [Bryobacterales bacterium]|nr:LysM peptidoglycan-binding domain-containing protein [Bryobacterales bacterium]
MSVLYGCVDGTGIADDKSYGRIYDNSFCHRVWKAWTSGPKEYIRGPWTAGWSTPKRAEMLAEWVSSNRSGANGIILAGHSRGGCAAIRACSLLKDQGIGVDYLFLFDAVNMQTLLDTHFIPSNVKYVYHALRGSYTRSRPFWGNCGRFLRSNSTVYRERSFCATHSGVGGIPWQVYFREVEGVERPANEFIWEDGEPNPTLVPMKQDVCGSREVMIWMLPTLWAARDALEEGGAPVDIVPADPKQQAGQQAGGRPAAGVPGGNGGAPFYTVVSGDSLSLISGRMWGDVLLWPILYKVNRPVVGSNPNLISAGMKLSVPNIKNYSSQELDQARSEGRNWR